MLKLLRDALLGFRTIVICYLLSSFDSYESGVVFANLFNTARAELAFVAGGASLAENGNDGKCGDYSFHTSNV